MGDIKYLSEENPELVYKFIVCCNKINYFFRIKEDNSCPPPCIE